MKIRYYRPIPCVDKSIVTGFYSILAAACAVYSSFIRQNRILLILKNSGCWTKWQGRMQSGYADFNPKLIDLDVLCRAAIAEFNDRPDERNRIRYVFPGSPLIARIDSRLIQQCVINLISNALKYSPPDKPICINLSSDDQTISLQITDEGIERFSEYLRTLSPRFKRRCGFRYRLGLSITERAIEQHGGTITVDTLVNEGTTFTIVIPITNS